MRQFQYYLSSDIFTPSPPTRELLRIDAESPADVLDTLIAGDEIPEGADELWLNVLVWVGDEGQQPGFESCRIR
jgi:hypothetical protein